jgi:hypothetical protein
MHERTHSLSSTTPGFAEFTMRLTSLASRGFAASTVSIAGGGPAVARQWHVSVACIWCEYGARSLHTSPTFSRNYSTWQSVMCACVTLKDMAGSSFPSASMEISFRRHVANDSTIPYTRCRTGAGRIAPGCGRCLKRHCGP